MADRTYLHWPFFEQRHRAVAEEAESWAAGHAESLADENDPDGSCRSLAASMGWAGLLRHAVPAPGHTLDVRALCLIRDILARHAALADFAFAMQGLGTGAITLFGTKEQRARLLPQVRDGSALAAFALSEKAAGSDVAALATEAAQDGPDWVINGEKTWISNGGIAAHYIVFARTGEGSKGLSAFAVPADAPGFSVVARIETVAPHPLGTLRFEDCRVPGSALIGRVGDGFRIALSVLDVFRATVGAAALGLARRALDEALRHARARHLFGAPLAAMPVTQAALADMALEVDAAALLVYRAAWAKDAGAERVTREASMAKLYATEAAQRVVDRAVQLHGGLGVTKGNKVEELYREVRALRIYEGASEVQRVVIARQLLEGRN
ncbi:MAG TPA: acyl-CoA dehydrogenase family protein [Acetobacteraceae bacterium]|nr:acyl-CoA dehydrogenase family protein [Acetobacteraceae bacterium]